MSTQGRSSSDLMALTSGYSQNVNLLIDTAFQTSLSDPEPLTPDQTNMGPVTDANGVCTNSGNISTNQPPGTPISIAPVYPGTQQKKSQLGTVVGIIRQTQNLKAKKKSDNFPSAGADNPLAALTVDVTSGSPSKATKLGQLVGIVQQTQSMATKKITASGEFCL